MANAMANMRKEQLDLSQIENIYKTLQATPAQPADRIRAAVMVMRNRSAPPRFAHENRDLHNQVPANTLKKVNVYVDNSKQMWLETTPGKLRKRGSTQTTDLNSEFKQINKGVYVEEQTGIVWTLQPWYFNVFHQVGGSLGSTYQFSHLHFAQQKSFTPFI
jgi:hypothetical protein